MSNQKDLLVNEEESEVVIQLRKEVADLGEELDEKIDEIKELQRELEDAKKELEEEQESDVDLNEVDPADMINALLEQNKADVSMVNLKKCELFFENIMRFKEETFEAWLKRLPA